MIFKRRSELEQYPPLTRRNCLTRFPDELEFFLPEVLAPTMTPAGTISPAEQEGGNGGSMPSLTAFFPRTSRNQETGETLFL